MSCFAVVLRNALDDEKTYDEREYEKQLLKEIFEVVNLRDNIVNSIEVDRQRSVFYLFMYFIYVFYIFIYFIYLCVLFIYVYYLFMYFIYLCIY